jgi:hypothetical protein
VASVAENQHQSSPASKPKVLFLVGKGRSGTTLLDVALSSLDGFFGCGELHFIWQEIDDRKCGCGRPIKTCPVWSQVLAEFDGGQLSQMSRWHDAVHSWRNLLRLMRARPGRIKWRALAGYISTQGRLYETIAQETGARVLVDSSKWPMNPGALGLIPGIEPYVVQLVRDPRAVAFSWQRTMVLHDTMTPRQMPRFGPVHSSASWTLRNLVAGRVRKRRPQRSMLLRYEDFAAQPRAALEALISLVDEETPLDILDGTALKVAENHTVAGNPSRFSTGAVQIRPDTAWQQELPAGRRRLVTALTSPLLRRYGYPIRTAKGPPRAQA